MSPAKGPVMTVTQRADHPPVPWTADPWLRWDVGQAAAVLAAIGILRGLLDGSTDSAYWRVRTETALELLGYAVNP